jgi:hypothetical protein
MKYTALFILAAGLITGCKKEASPPAVAGRSGIDLFNSTVIANEPCDALYPSTGPTDNLVPDSVWCEYPCANPNNTSEIVFLKTTRSNLAPRLVVYNVTTGAERTIYNGAVTGNQLSWGRNGWILFKAYNHARSAKPIVCRIQPDGSQFTELILDNNNDYDGLGWSYSGGEYFCVRNREMLLIKHMVSNITLDSVPMSDATGCNRKGQIVGNATAPDAKQIMLYDMHNRSVTNLSTQGMPAADGACWMPDGERLVYIQQGSGFGIL